MIRKLGSLGLGVALLAAQPAMAGALDEVGPARSRLGMFAGARVRLNLGGAAREPVRAGLTLTGVRALDRADGRRRTAYGEGIEFGFAGGKAPTWSLAGRPVGDAVARRNLSTVGTIAVIGGGVLLVAGIGLLILDAKLDAASD